MEFKPNIVSCANGHYYDSSKHSICPVCNGTQQMPETSAPDSAGGGYGDMSATIAPNAESDGGYTPFGVPTVGPDGLPEEGKHDPVVGWLVCIEGTQYGADFRIHSGYNYIGRDIGDIQLRYDNRISRQKHAMIAFDGDSQLYFFGPIEGRTLVSVNGAPVLNAQQIKSYDVIVIGASKFLFIGLCGEQFNWKKQDEEEEEK